MHQRHQPRRNLEGQVLILFALFGFVLIGAMALALDVGYLLTERRGAQATADAAALAGAHALWQREGLSGADSTARDYAAKNGAGADTEVWPDPSGDHKNGKVVVDIQQPVSKFFVGALYSGNWEVGAHAVAAVHELRDGQYALIALDDAPGMFVEGSINVSITNGSAMSNGNVDRNGTSSIVTTDGSIDAAGTVDPGPSWTAPDGFNSKWPQYDDPLAGLTPPLPPGAPLDPLDHPDMAPCMPGYGGSPADCVLVPGYYKDLGQIKVHETATLLPGLYYFENTSIFMEGSGSRLTDNDGGVMLYFANGTSPSTTYFDPANSDGGIHLTAPAVSPPSYPDGLDGMTLWIDNCSEFDARGSGEFYLKGVFYAPCSDVRLHGNPYGDTVDGQVIVGNLTVHGSAEFNIRYHNYVATPRYGVTLIE